MMESPVLFDLIFKLAEVQPGTFLSNVHAEEIIGVKEHPVDRVDSTVGVELQVH